MMKDLKYRVERPQYLRMTLEDCSMCLTNFNDPVFSSVAVSQIQADCEIEELMDVQCNQLELPDFCPIETASQSVKFEDAVKNLADSIYYSTFSGSGKIQSPKIEQWLSDNFKEHEDKNVARREMYNYYCECCKFHRETPCNQATFGKIVRVVFPGIKTRRIGIRGHSRYHYFGIGPVNNKEKFSPSIPHRSYFRHEADDHNPAVVLQSQDRVRPNGYQDVELFLADFPTIETVAIKCKHKILAFEFLQMYKDHAVTLISSIVNAEFDKAIRCISEFWTGLPVKMYPLLNQSDFVSVVEQCDLLVYFVINDILVPTVPYVVNKGITEAVKSLLHCLPECLTNSLILLPDLLRTQKLKVYQEFQKCIQKQLHISCIYTVACVVLKNQDVATKLLTDWKHMDSNEVYGRISAVVQQIDLKDVLFYIKKIEMILNSKEDIPKQLTRLVHTVLQTYWKSTDRQKPQIQLFVLQWSYISGQIIQLLAEEHSSVTGLFLLLEVLCKDYLMFLIEKHVEI
ncbi:regulatory factor X 1/2/3 [Mytilus galloprovincialis]|uniref:Regulatory factor X 1/2/3 n=2 Tax=Mytilus galloprovincialis TaxID=29158 RepID=A0A8B6GG82_MYTGA|nr:regulatory factor X 1/2/3 [Mytilus galloprovincialis]